MEKQTMGRIISNLRKQRGMTQKDLAEQMGVTDKAVSKWERDLSCPDIASLPALAQALGVRVEELLNVPAQQAQPETSRRISGAILKALPLAMGAALTVTAVLGESNGFFFMAGLGIFCLALRNLEN